uniref:BTB domain-containing protein n=1 Tax=Parascaris equorum TaxID=6256 RepID=A0A914RXE5_PAREQ
MRHVLMRSPESRLWMSIQRSSLSEDNANAPFLVSNGTIFLDGDAELVRILINALRHPRMELVVPDKFDKWSALLAEVVYTY